MRIMNNRISKETESWVWGWDMGFVRGTWLVSQGSLVRYPVWQHTFVSPSAFSRKTVVSYWQKYVHEVLVNRLGGLGLPRKIVVRLTDPFWYWGWVVGCDCIKSWSLPLTRSCPTLSCIPCKTEYMGWPNYASSTFASKMYFCDKSVSHPKHGLVRRIVCQSHDMRKWVI